VTEFAETVGLAKATVSEPLHRAEETVVKSTVIDAQHDTATKDSNVRN